MIPARRSYFEVQVPVRRSADGPSRRRVVDFSRPGEAARWRPIDDVVMGGVSSSRLRASEAGCAFEGTVSLERGGGFASVRCEPGTYDLTGLSALTLRVRGDGQTYKLRLATSDAPDAVVFQATFETRAGEWTEHDFAVGDFFPVWRGRSVWDAPPLQLAQVRALGLLVSDRQEGPFRLELAWLDGRRAAAHDGDDRSGRNGEQA